MAKKEKSCNKATSRRADKDMWMASWHSPRNELKVVIQHQHHISGTCEWQVKRQSQRSAGGEGANKLWDSLIEIATKRGRKQGIIRPKHTPAQLPSAFYLYHLLFLSLSFPLLIDSSEHQHKIRLNGARSANYHSIEWTQPRIDQLYTMYIQEPLSMQCNKSDGQRFNARNWEGVPTTPVQIKIPIHRKLCPNYNPLWLKPLEKGECDLLGECIY